MERITDNEYHEGVLSIADELVGEARAGDFGTGEQAREGFQDRIWEYIDGHRWVIYTFHAQTVCALSENDGYSAENFGLESIVTDGSLNWSAIAFGALYADVCEALWRVEGFDVNDPNPGDE